ncbi:MAG: phosphatidylglycerol lysyltransferase domain-containing protein [Endomicrobium sp.]|jgi:phosphatidylglycerol lysyltransferase|nr:phosphatidylglycerol lysyltransferase domain-containing protein [Endomicrobium sp.]
MKKWIKIVLIPLGFLIFVGTLILLHNQLKNLSYSDVIDALKAIPAVRIAIALCMAMLYYLVLGGYDIVAFKFIDVKNPIKPKDILFTCFISNVLANNTGYSMLFGGSIRYRLYSLYNVSMIDVTKVLLFSSATIWLGLLSVGGFIFTLAPVSLEGIFNLNFSTRIIGIISLSILILYVLFSTLNSKPRKIFKWTVSFPNIKIVIAQTLLATSDWIIASLTLFVLMPEGYISYFVLLKVFLVSQFLVIISQVPGGMGVLETSITILMPNSANNPGIISALLAYRAIFYFFPLLIALTMLGAFEIMVFTKKFNKTAKIFGNTVSSLVVQVIALCSFFAGMIAMFSASTPFNVAKLKYIISMLPPWFADLSHFLLTIVSLGILFISRALQLRVKRAWTISCYLIAFAITLIFIVGEPILVLVCFIALFVVLLFSKKYFYRDISVLKTNLSSWWLCAIGGVFSLSVWIGFFVNRQDILSWIHLDIFFSNLLNTSDAARFLRASFGVGAIIFIVIVEQILKNFFSKSVSFTKEDIVQIAYSSNYSYAFYSLAPDKEFIINDEKDAFIMYAKSKDSWIVLEDPVGKSFHKNELLWKFKELADDMSAKPAFLGIDGKYAQIYDDVGLDIFDIGQEAKIELNNFDKSNEKFKSFYDLENKLETEGFIYKSLKSDMFSKYKAEFSEINKQWMQNTDYFEMNFIPGKYDESYMQNMDFSIVEKNSKIYAFSIFFKTGNKHEISSEIVRYLKSEYDLFSYIIFKNIIYAKDDGYRLFDLGFAYFNQSENSGELAKYFAKMFMFAEHFKYNIALLRDFKERFYPVWRNKYIAIHPDKYIISFIKNFANLVSPKKTISRKNYIKVFLKR